MEEPRVLQTARLTGFVGVRDLGEAERFYGEILDLELHDERPFAFVARLG